MAIVITPYETKDFNNLWDFDKAGPAFDDAEGATIVYEEMKQLFRMHDVQHVFGLQLLHQHFPLKDGERLVEFNGTSTPVINVDQQLHAIAPSILSVQKAGARIELHPVEFKIKSGNAVKDESSLFCDKAFQNFVASKAPFFQEFHEVAKKFGLTEILGLARYPGAGFPGRVEMSVGRSCINLTPDQSSIYSIGGQAREATWYFTDDYIQHGCKCLCPEDKANKHQGHSRHVITR
jgi:hypothetical protein